MRTIYAIHFGLAPLAGQTARASYNDLVGMICAWVEGKYGRWWATTVSLPFDGQTLTPLPSHSIRGLASATGESELFTLDWMHPDDSDPSTAWVTNCIAARHGECLQVSVIVRISTNRTVLRPVRFDLGRPRIVTDILAAFRASIDGWPVPTDVEHIASPQIQGYVDNVLLNANRNLPVIMSSPDTWHGRDTVDANVILGKLKGFAQVAVLADKWAAFKLTDVVEKPLSCYDGAVRIYWPGFTLDDDPFQHKLFLPQSIRYHEGQGLPLHDYLFRTLAAVASFRHTEGSVIREARQAIDQQEKKKINDVRDQVKAGLVEKNNLETQLLSAFERIDALTKERDEAKADLAAQHAAWAEVQQAMAVSEADKFETEPEQKIQFSTVLEAVEQAKKDFSGAIVFLDSALESAKDSPYKDPNRVYELLEAMALVAGEWKENDGKLGRSWNDALAELGFDLRDQVSQTSRTRFSDDYKFMYKGQRRLFEKHITVGAKQADKCCSVHWYRDDEHLVLAVGHCGRHLSNTTS